MHTYNGVLTVLGLAHFFVLCVSVNVKLTALLLCVCMHSVWKGPQNDLYCVGRDVKPYSVLTHYNKMLGQHSALVYGLVFSFWLQLKMHLLCTVVGLYYSYLPFSFSVFIQMLADL